MDHQNLKYIVSINAASRVTGHRSGLKDPECQRSRLDKKVKYNIDQTFCTLFLFYLKIKIRPSVFLLKIFIIFFIIGFF